MGTRDSSKRFSTSGFYHKTTSSNPITNTQSICEEKKEKFFKKDAEKIEKNSIQNTKLQIESSGTIVRMDQANKGDNETMKLGLKNRLKCTYLRMLVMQCLHTEQGRPLSFCNKVPR